MTVKELSELLGHFPYDFDVCVIGLFGKPVLFDYPEIFDIQVSYMKKTVLIFPQYFEENSKNV